MATSASLMEKKVALDVSEDVKKKLKSVREKAAKAMSLAQDVAAKFAKSLTEGNQGLRLGNEGLHDLADVLRNLDPSSRVFQELKRVQAEALKSNEEGSFLIAELERCKTQISICGNQGDAALAYLDSIIKSLGCVVSAAPILSLPSIAAPVTSSDKKTASEEDIKRKLEAIRDKASRAMAIAAEVGADLRKTVTMTAEGLSLGDAGLDELSQVLRGLPPTSELAQQLRDVQKQALDSNATGNFAMASIGNCAARASVCRNIGNAGIANLDSVIANLSHLLDVKASILTFSAPAMAARDASTLATTKAAGKVDVAVSNETVDQSAAAARDSSCRVV